MEKKDAVKAVLVRNEFYKDSRGKISLVLILSFLLNVLLTIMLVYIVSNPPKPKYFATSISGRITPLFPLNMPNQSDAAVLQWANQAAVASFTYNYVNYRQELQAASGFFTGRGWRIFLDALEQSNNLEAVRAKKLIVSASATRAPKILQKQTIGGRYSWRITMPILVTYRSETEFSQERNNVTLLVTRVSTLNSPRGIGIDQIVVAPGGTS